MAFQLKYFERNSDSKRLLIKKSLWYFLNYTLFASSIPGSSWRRWMLKIFGASIGIGVVIKPRVNIKYPWNLSIGNFCWIGEASWIDNIEMVEIHDNVCISQGVYFCTGNHNYYDIGFKLMAKKITVLSHTWVTAFYIIQPGSTLGPDCVYMNGKTKNLRD